MKLNLEAGSQAFLIGRHEAGRIQIGGAWYNNSLIVLPQQLIQPWAAPALDTLDIQEFDTILSSINVLLIGTGPRQRFAPAVLAADLAARGIGLECMNTAAVCRTYNVLAAEGREVAAAIYLEAPA